MKYIKRNKYLDYMMKFKDKQIIKVVTGVRRSGKSVLIKQYADMLRERGVSDDNIIFINFEDFDFLDLRSSIKLYEYVRTRLKKNEMTYIFLDEIQHVDNYAEVVDALFVKENVDLYITGSNAYMLSTEIATMLSGRYVELRMLPFSLAEYRQVVGDNVSVEKSYANYITYSSFPYAASLADDAQAVSDYLRGIYSTIVLKDVAQRNKIGDLMMLESVMAFLSDNVGNTLSTKSIADTMTSSGRKIDVKTVDKYVSALRESCIVYNAQRYDVRGKCLLKTMEKYYLVDVALRNMLLGSGNSDLGRVLENVVFLELVRRYPKVYVGKVEQMEVDFVVLDGQAKHYYQVCATMRDDATRERELKPLQSIPDNFQRTVLTLDPDPITYHNGIKQEYALDWLLNV